MQVLEERLIASLHDSEITIDLREHELTMVSVHVGYTALQFVANAPNSILFALQDKEKPTYIKGEVVELKQGHTVQIGRMQGVEVVGLSLPVDSGLVETIQEDAHVSRRHAQVDIISPVEMIVRDLKSRNGTFVKDMVQTREFRRSRLRLVE